MAAEILSTRCDTAKLISDEWVFMIEWCTSEAAFKIRRRVFDQTDGVDIGSPLRPISANLYLHEYEDYQIV